MGFCRPDKENKEAIDTALCFCNGNSRDLNRNRNKYRRQKPLTVAENKTVVRNCFSKQQADKQPFLFHFLDCENEKLQVLQCYVPITASPLYEMDHSLLFKYQEKSNGGPYKLQTEILIADTTAKTDYQT